MGSINSNMGNLYKTCVNLLFWLCFGGISVCVRCMDLVDKELDTDVPDRPFPSSTSVHGANITCSEEIPRGLKFPAQTWTCYDARVDGLRMAYGIYPGVGVDSRCTETKGFDELTQLCRELMGKMEVYQPLWAAFVTNATCEYHKGDRKFLTKVVGGYAWANMSAGHGYIHTFRCMADKPSL